MDRVTREQRSKIMSRVRSKDTGPEWKVRRLIHGMGYRYRLHRRDLPGTPDLVFSSKSKIVFVHGCFWHGHRCRYGRLPKTKLRFWRRKIDNNRKRDAKNTKALRDAGWKTAVIWQCELKKERSLRNKLKAF